MKFQLGRRKDLNSNEQKKFREEEEGEEGVEESNSPAPRGLTLLTSSLFLVGEVAGCGLLSFPWALSRTGWSGILLMLAFAGVATYAATVLGRCWIIICQRFPEYRYQPVRHPYPLIGQLAFGKPCRYGCNGRGNLVILIYISMR
ncbi:amino acid transporter [Elysia marginata]|uniref:Amino acid transporter n=1 Tax=Elysia marginata TaxID=1093978 RepID=A0AAV4GSI5_9GAST|nr:amino acid transporter [Elysia marginata]